MIRHLMLAAAICLAVPLSSAHVRAEQAVTITPGEPMMLPVDPDPLVVATTNGDRNFTIEIADEERERSAGLMFRRSMADDHGMLFVFEQTRRLAFWMKNTPMPLDLVFIGDDGRVVSVLQGEPFSTAPISPGGSSRFVLELKAGTAQKAGIGNGDRVRHPLIDKVAGEG
jgi:uncharacterized membrane protein (UPF0127 family)